MMSKNILFSFTLLQLIISVFASFPSGYLWRIEDSSYGQQQQQQRPSYLFGTVHAPIDQVRDTIPEAAREAFFDAHHLLLARDQRDTETLGSCMILPDNQTLDQILPEELYRRVKSLMEGLSTKHTRLSLRGTLDVWKTPRWLYFAVSELAWKDPGWDPKTPHLERWLSLLARVTGKTMGTLETASEVCRSVNDFSLNDTMNLLEECNYLSNVYDTSVVLEKYRAGGDLEPFEHGDCGRGWMVGKYPMHDQRERSRKLASRIATLLRRFRGETFFVALGVSHFFGEDNVVELLRKEGFDVRRVTGDEIEEEDGDRDVSSSPWVYGVWSLCALLWCLYVLGFV